MSDFRAIIGNDRTPIQQSLAVDDSDYRHFRMSSPMVGVILEVLPADTVRNKSAMRDASRRGYYHECKVLLVGNNSASNLIVNHVIITPDGCTGLDSYQEQLPRGSSNSVDGGEFQVGTLDPHMLDGDWCVVGFLGGSLDHPFVLRWWPHPKNWLDPATSGLGNPDRNGNPKALDQSNRYFSRKNGVETVITGAGDVYFSTVFASSELLFTEDSQPTEGRWPRNTQPDSGGSVSVNIKDSQTIEILFDKVEEGKGIMGRSESYLPQTNPRPTNKTAEGENLELTYLRLNKDEISAKIPTLFKVTCGDEILMESETSTLLTSDSITLTADSVVELEAPTVNLGTNAVQGGIRAEDLKAWLKTAPILTAMGPAFIDSAHIDATFDTIVSTKVFIE